MRVERVVVGRVVALVEAPPSVRIRVRVRVRVEIRVRVRVRVRFMRFVVTGGHKGGRGVRQRCANPNPSPHTQDPTFMYMSCPALASVHISCALSNML